MYKIRNVKLKDIKKVFDLSNEPEVRQVSINKAPIKWENHVKWFSNRIKNKNMPFYIAEDKQGNFIGQIRFEENHDEIIISISLTKEWRSKGIGRRLIEESINKSGFKKISAYIFDYNTASLKAFEHANFQNSHLLKYNYIIE